MSANPFAALSGDGAPAAPSLFKFDAPAFGGGATAAPAPFKLDLGGGSAAFGGTTQPLAFAPLPATAAGVAKPAVKSKVRSNSNTSFAPLVIGGGDTAATSSALPSFTLPATSSSATAPSGLFSLPPTPPALGAPAISAPTSAGTAPPSSLFGGTAAPLFGGTSLLSMPSVSASTAASTTTSSATSAPAASAPTASLFSAGTAPLFGGTSLLGGSAPSSTTAPTTTGATSAPPASAPTTASLFGAGSAPLFGGTSLLGGSAPMFGTALPTAAPLAPVVASVPKEENTTTTVPKVDAPGAPAPMPTFNFAPTGASASSSAPASSSLFGGTGSSLFGQAALVVPSKATESSVAAAIAPTSAAANAPLLSPPRTAASTAAAAVVAPPSPLAAQQPPQIVTMEATVDLWNAKIREQAASVIAKCDEVTTEEHELLAECRSLYAVTQQLQAANLESAEIEREIATTQANLARASTLSSTMFSELEAKVQQQAAAGVSLPDSAAAANPFDECLADADLMLSELDALERQLNDAVTEINADTYARQRDTQNPIYVAMRVLDAHTRKLSDLSARCAQLEAAEQTR